MDFSTLMPIFMGLVFAVVLFGVAKSVAEWMRNNSQPVLSIPARIVSKRTHTRRQNSSVSTSDFSNTSTSTRYFITFELESGERLEFSVRGKAYGLIVDGDEGVLTHQGTRYHRFQRRI